MKKRIFAAILFLNLLMPMLMLSVAAYETTSKGFPFSNYSDCTIVISGDTEAANYYDEEYFAEGNVTVYAYESYDPNKYQPYRAMQSAVILMNKIPGLKYDQMANPYISYVVELLNEEDKNKKIAWFQDAYDRTTIKDGYGDYGSYYKSTLTTSGGKTVYERSSDENELINGEIVPTIKDHFIYSIRPVKEIPGLYLYIDCSNQASRDESDYNSGNYSTNESYLSQIQALDYTVAWIDNFYDSKAPTETKQNETTKSNSGVTQQAGEQTGEDGGISVPAAIVVGVVAGALGIGAAAAAIGSSEENKNKKTYKMYVQKDFGDGIRKGKDQVLISARMAEVDAGGLEHDRDDLTAKITAVSEEMVIHSARITGRYLQANVSVPNDYKNSTANITFNFTGEGGTFSNTVVFRVIEGPSLRFLYETETEGEFRPNNENCGINMISGDGFTYTEHFMIVDAMTPPKVTDITAQKLPEFDVTFEETNRQYVYKMIVRNNTKSKKNDDVFAKKKEEGFEIQVRVDDAKEPVKGLVIISLYPEGITVSSDMEGKKGEVKYVRVQAYEKEEYGDLDNKWQVSEIILTLAHKGKDKAVIVPNAKYKSEKLKGADGKGMATDKEQSVADKFKYNEEFDEWNEKSRYILEPNSNLVEPDDGTFYMVLLPVSCEYEGTTYSAELPIRLKGKEIETISEWDIEYKNLKRRVEKYSLPSNKDKWLERLENCAFDPKVSVEELRLTSKWILREYMDYWTNQNKHDLSEAKMYNTIVNVLEWTKFAGDCAFSFLINMYAGPVADAILSPAKDFATSAIGEVIAARTRGEPLDIDNFEFSKNLAQAGDNLLTNNIKLTDWKKAAATLGGYFVYSALKNYILKLREENVSDIYGALCEAFKDLTFAVMKKMGGDLIGKWLKDSKTFQNKIVPYLQKYFQETQITTLQHRINDSLGLEGDLRKAVGYANDADVTAKVADVVEKYIGDLVGSGFDKLRECYDSSKFTNEGGHTICYFNLRLLDAFEYGIRLDLSATLTNLNYPLFGWFYNLFFEGVPCAMTLVEKPKDPPLPPAEN